MRCVWCALVTVWLTVGLTFWTVAVSSGCAGTYDPELLREAEAAAQVDAGTDDDAGYEVTGP